MGKPLSERVAAVVGDSGRLADVLALLDECRAAQATATCEAAAARQRSLDPDLTPAEAREVREIGEDREHDGRRYARWIEQLEARKAAIEATEKAAATRAEYEAAMAERDQLAADIREHYPRICAELEALQDRIVASDARCEAAKPPAGKLKLESAEMIAREMRRLDALKDGSAAKRLIQVELPDLIEPRPFRKRTLPQLLSWY